MSLFRSAFTVGSFTLLSRILGYVRDILIAATLGAGFLADAFFVAFRLPNFFRTLSAEGAFNAAFVPLFSGKLETEGKEKALGFAGHVLSFMFVALLIITILMQIFMPAVMHVLAPGFTDDAEKFDVTVSFARIVFPYLIFISIVSLFSGILNSIGKFAAAASVPIWLNICMIFSLLVLAKYTETPAHALAWGVVLAGVVQLLWILTAAYKNAVRLKISFPKPDKDVKTLLKRMVPGIIGGGVTQINLWVNTVIATTMSGAVSYLYYADRLVQFPLAIIGTAMGTALLPTLSRQIKGKKLAEAIATQNKALEIVLLLTIPAAAALMVIATPLISVMFERGAFGAKETVYTAAALVAYGAGLPAFVMIKIFAPSFFANGDTKTPVKIAAVCLVANVAISLSLIGHIGHIGLAIATSFTAWLNTALLCGILVKRGLYKGDRKLNKRLLRIMLAAFIMAMVLWSLQGALAGYLNAGLADKLFAVTILIVGGIVTFFITAHVLKGARIKELKKMMGSADSNKGFTLVELSIVIVIISLIVAGVVAGQNIVKQAQLRGVISDYQKFQVSINSFKLQYDALPGDFNNAFAYWGTNCAADAGRCDGNGNKQIAMGGGAEYNEAYRAWQHLGLAGLVEGGFTGIAYGTGIEANIGVNVPAGSFSNGGFSFFHLGAISGLGYTGGWTGSRNLLVYGGYLANQYSRGNIFTPKELHGMDKKMDDGLPAQGILYGSWASPCANSLPAATAVYNLVSTNLLCTPWFYF